MITEATIKSFQQAIKSEYQIALDEKDAREILTNLVGYFDVLVKINHREQSEDRGSLASPI